MTKVSVYAGGSLGDYHFGAQHPFGPARHDAFMQSLEDSGLQAQCRMAPPQLASRDQIALFHTEDYIDRVIGASATGVGYLDQGDTPARIGIYQAASRVAGTVLLAIDEMISGVTKRAFVPIAGLHHARREKAAGFCVFNDCGIAIEALRHYYGIKRIAYIDIDAHHGDGVFYAFEEDPDLIFVDLHEDGRYLYPGTGSIYETGQGAATGTKLNIPMPPGADDALFYQAWEKAERFLDASPAEFYILHAGADSLEGDPITEMRYTSAAHHHAASRLAWLADRHAEGRLLAVGGGGYNLDNLADAWSSVVKAMIEN